MFDTDSQLETEREARRQQKAAAAQHRKDVQQVFEQPAARRLLAAFVRDAGYDTTAFRSDPGQMAHAVGWQDAAGWWIAQLREHCPEREAQMRTESRNAAPPQDDTND